MSQNLTQPEEIDRILREMAGHDMKAGKSIPDDVLNGGLHDSQCNWPIGVTGSSCGMAHKEPMHGSPDPEPYVRIM